MTDRRKTELPNQPGVFWYSSKFLLDLQMSIQSQGVTNIPVTGFVEIHEKELDQREAFMWQTIKVDGTHAEKPKEATRILMARPALKGGSDLDWAAKLSEAQHHMDVAVQRMVANYKGEVHEYDKQLDGWTWTDADGKIHTQEKA